MRRAAVAGYFYPRDPAELRAQLTALVTPAAERAAAVAVVAPHAGYVYSGAVAGAVYASVVLPRAAIVLGPNHTGRGAPVSINREGAWETPLGLIRVDERLAALLERQSRIFVDEPEAHAAEHSIEVQLPFLQHLRPDAGFVPVCVGTSDPDELREIGAAVSRAISRYEEGVLIVASSDLSHYETDAVARGRDALVVADIERLDETAMLTHVFETPVTMCGYGSVAAAIAAARLRGTRRGRLVRYATSGDASGDLSRVVGYAGMVLD